MRYGVDFDGKMSANQTFVGSKSIEYKADTDKNGNLKKPDLNDRQISRKNGSSLTTKNNSNSKVQLIDTPSKD